MHVASKHVIAFAELMAISEIVTVQEEAKCYSSLCITATAAAAAADVAVKESS